MLLVSLKIALVYLNILEMEVHLLETPDRFVACKAILEFQAVFICARFQFDIPFAFYNHHLFVAVVVIKYFIYFPFFFRSSFEKRVGIFVKEVRDLEHLVILFILISTRPPFTSSVLPPDVPPFGFRGIAVVNRINTGFFLFNVNSDNEGSSVMLA